MHKKQTPYEESGSKLLKTVNLAVKFMYAAKLKNSYYVFSSKNVWNECKFMILKMFLNMPWVEYGNL